MERRDMDVRGRPWTSMDVRGRPWTSMLGTVVDRISEPPLFGFEAGSSPPKISRILDALSSTSVSRLQLYTALQKI